MLISEGPTDTATLLDLGFVAVGRPSCTGGIRHLCNLVRRLEFEEAVIVGDGDGPGRRGADDLAAVLVAYVPTVRVVIPSDGVKDARAWKQAGASAADVEKAIAGEAVRRLNITKRISGNVR